MNFNGSWILMDGPMKWTIHPAIFARDEKETRHPDGAPRSSATEAQLVRLVPRGGILPGVVFSFLGNWHVKKYQAYYMIKEHQCKEMYLYIYVYHMHIHVYKYMYVFIHIRYIFIYTRIICIINYLEYRFAFTVYPKMLAVVQHTCPVRLSPTTHLHRCLAYSSWPNKAKKKWCCSPGGRWAMP